MPVELINLVHYSCAGPRQKACAYPIRFRGQTEVQTRWLNLVYQNVLVRENIPFADHVSDLLIR